MSIYSQEAENSVIASILELSLQDQAMLEVYESLTADMFASRNTRELFEVIQKLHDDGQIVDIASVVMLAPEHRAKVFDIREKVVITARQESNLSILKQKRKERVLFATAQFMIETLRMDIMHKDKMDRVYSSLAGLDDIENLQDGAQPVRLFDHVRDLVVELSDQVEGKAESKDILKTGYYELDNLTNGFVRGDLITLGARTSVGKSTLGLNIAENASKNGYNVLYVTMEMSGKELAKRSVSSLGRVNNVAFKRPKEASKTDWDNLTIGVSKIKDLELFTVSMSRPTVEEIKSVARSFKRQRGIDFLVIDHLHLMSHGSENDVQGIANTTANLKGLAVELNAPVLLMAQLNRGNAKEERMPTITDLRGSGAIEQDSNMVLLLHRNQELDNLGHAILYIAKNRDGKAQQGVSLANSLQYFRFDNMKKAADDFYADNYGL